MKPVKPSRIDFEGIDIQRIGAILAGSGPESLTPHEREYFSYMDMVRGLRARMLLPGGGKLVTKAGILKMLRTVYGLSDWMARRIYTDALNFFYADEEVTPKAWRNLYAEKLEKMADLAFSTGKLKEGRALLTDAARLRGCFDEAAPEIPRELLDQRQTVVYSGDAASIGAPSADRKELEAFIDSLPDMPEVSRSRVKEDAGIVKMNLLKRMTEDVREFTEDDD